MHASFMIILLGTSGAGKTTLRDYVLDQNKEAKKLIAMTDRSPRTAERDGVDKYFVRPDVFRQLDLRGELCLVNEVFGHMYAFKKRDFEGDGIYLGELYYKNLKDFKQFHPNMISIYIKSQAEAALRSLYSRGSPQEEIAIREKTQLIEVKELDTMQERGIFDYVFNNEYTEKSKRDFNRLIETILHENRGESE